MTDVENKPGDDALERATAALRNEAVDQRPSDAVVHKTLMRLRELERQGGDSRRKIWNMKTLGKLAVAALLAVVIGGMMFWDGGRWGNQLAFGDVLERIQKIASLRAKMIVVLGGEQKNAKPIEAMVTMAGSRMREELLGHVIVLDLEKNQMLRLDPKNKTAMVTDFVNFPKDKMPVNFLDQMRKMTAKDAQELGEEKVDGRVMRKFKLVRLEQEMTVWVDPDTHLPVKVETELHTGAATRPATHAVMSDFEWNVAVNELEMSVTPPPGYIVETSKLDASPPSERDLIASLRVLAEANDGRFPDQLDSSAMVKAVTQQLQAKRATSAQAALDVKAMTAKLTTWSRGQMFITAANGEDWQYAGAGVKLGAKDRPVMWYRPAGSTAYHVIFGDLSVKEMVKNQLPKVATTTVTGLSGATTTQRAAAPAS
jgi:outer membrane lipoprotein-sorting protein